MNDFGVVPRLEKVEANERLKWMEQQGRKGRGQMELPTVADFGYLHHNRYRKGVAVGP